MDWARCSASVASAVAAVSSGRSRARWARRLGRAGMLRCKFRVPARWACAHATLLAGARRSEASSRSSNAVSSARMEHTENL